MGEGWGLVLVLEEVDEGGGGGEIGGGIALEGCLSVVDGTK
jgi:hypothetical protein